MRAGERAQAGFDGGDELDVLVVDERDGRERERLRSVAADDDLGVESEVSADDCDRGAAEGT